MASFPSSQERTVASAMLLLYTTPPSLSLSPPRFDFDLNETAQERSVSKSSTESFVWCDSKCSSSSLIYDDGSSQEIKARGSGLLSAAAAAARCRGLAFKVVRKSRTKTLWASSDPKPNSDLASKASSTSISTEASSCLSSSSSGMSSARSLRYRARARARGKKLLGIVGEPKHAKNAANSPHIRRRADAILKFLSDGGSSEVRIRQVLGDSPDTSKALRMLLRLDEVKRSGSGGRHDPYIYTIVG